MIDGMNISEMSLDHLRDNITIIPQDPTLFAGTLRFNLDPNGKATNEDILNLLYKAGLQNLLSREKSSEKTSQLDMEIAENGSNLSSGEKQLICICRAILRKNKIIVLDEATANIDLITE